MKEMISPMIKRNSIRCFFLSVALSRLFAQPGVLRAEDVPPDVVLEAMSDELQRSMESLYVEGLARPYFIHYQVEDRYIVSLSSAYEGLLRADDNRMRSFRSRVRVGSPALDNTNVGGSFGGRTNLPLDDDYVALRHGIWQATDSDYKRAVETLARKEAFLKQKTVEDRPDDFSEAESVQDLRPRPDFALDQAVWENRVRQLSGLFKSFPEIQNARVDLLTGVSTNWIVTSEGTRLRWGDTGAILQISAELQAPEGMRLSDQKSYIAKNIDRLPAMSELTADVKSLGSRLMALREAPVLEHYVGPVLFEPQAAAKVFESMLIQGLCARPTPLGAGGSDQGFEKKIGTRILPRSFYVYDDPTVEEFEGHYVAGSYRYDDEGVRARRVDLVEKGVLKTLLASRSPTKKIKRTTGHGRSGSLGDVNTMIGCLFVNDEDGVSREELRRELIDAAREEGLEFGLRVESMESGGGNLGDPVFAYKVYVADGREELIRGMKFMPVEMRSLKRIIAAGKDREVYNVASGVAYSIIAPAIVFEELELTKAEEELDKLPVLKSPATRASDRQASAAKPDVATEKTDAGR